MVVLVPADMVRTDVAGADAPANVSVVLRRATWTVEKFEESRRAWELPSWPLDDTMRQSGTYASSFGVRSSLRSYTDTLKRERRDIEVFVEMEGEPAPPGRTIAKFPRELRIKKLVMANARARFIKRYLQRIEDEADSSASSMEETFVL